MSHQDIDPEVVNAGTKPEEGWESRDLEASFWPILKATGHFLFWSTICILIVIPIQNGLTGNSMLRIDLGEYRPRWDTRLPENKNVPMIQSGARTAQDIHDLRRKENDIENHAGWVDKKKGIARMPIEDAIKAVSAEGLPAAKPKGGTTP